jgi:hypothetical protein
MVPDSSLNIVRDYGRLISQEVHSAGSRIDWDDAYAGFRSLRNNFTQMKWLMRDAASVKRNAYRVINLNHAYDTVSV